MQDLTSNKKTRISVNTQDVEEVIRVGASSQSIAEGETSVVEPVEAFAGSEESPAPVVAATEQPSAPSSVNKAHAKKNARDGYRETTLEDIESTKMSTMQKVIIAVAAVALIAFAIWYFAF